ncbi:ABC transporter substrate-binding protein [Acetobacteraceae bacterium H6797]|nr:ABC transporter substrate-binding protein [Acetobacteraceae bacterium H6797]
MTKRSRRLPALLLGLAALAATPAGAQTLTMGVSAAPSSVDPHFHNGTSNQTLTYQLFDTLFERQPDTSLTPALAASWKPIGDTVWEIRLRPGVIFTDGHPFTAEDVAFTIKRVPEVPNATARYIGSVRSIDRVEIVDPLTLHIHTKGPSPFLPVDLSNVAIVSRHIGETATTEDYNSGKAAIGTGPYRLVSYRASDQVELARNDNWWGRRPDWEKVTIRFLPNTGGRTAALLSGSVDLIDTPSPNDLPNFEKDDRFRVWQHPGMRLVYLAPNLQSDALPMATDNDGKPLATNPLKDLRVREALSIAINRDGLARRIMQGTAIPNGQFVPPGAYSYAPQAPVPAYDPARARRLLAEAGYPNGFRVVLPLTNNTRPTDPTTGQAIAQMWTQIGVQTTVEAMPLAAYSPRAARMEFPFSLFGWGAAGHSGHPLVNVVNTNDREKLTGSFNRSGYSNPALDELTARALATMDDKQRESLLQEAVGMAMKDVSIIPLYQLTNFWVTRKGVAYRASAQDYTQAKEATLEK